LRGSVAPGDARRRFLRPLRSPGMARRYRMMHVMHGIGRGPVPVAPGDARR